MVIGPLPFAENCSPITDATRVSVCVIDCLIVPCE